MEKNKEQEKRLDYLLEEFKADSVEYKNIEIPEDINRKRCILRSLMNVRMPKKMSDSVLKVQDEYLSVCTEEKGIVQLSDIPVTKGNISIWQGDITRLEVDAIVNAANSQMLGCFIPMHMCIDNQIHTYAGVQLREECSHKMEELRDEYGSHYEQPTSVPMITELADCYTNVLNMCLENNLKSVAFCCISTGVFGFPNKRAAEIAVKTVKEWSLEHPEAMKRIIFNVFKEEDKKYYEEILQ